MVLSPAHAREDSADEPASSVVRTVELCKWIDGRPVLRDINLDIPAGQFVIVMGANGAGKSTLLRTLATLLAPSSGELHLFGQPVRHHGPHLRARIGVIDHQPMLYRDLTALENLEFFGKLYGLPRPAQRAEEMLARLGLADRGRDFVRTFSRGMTQRVAIARALLHDPDLILADEPFTGLDVAASAMLEQLFHHAHEAGKTIIMVHHDFQKGLQLAEQAVMLRTGRVVIDRPSRQLDLATALKEAIPA